MACVNVPALPLQILLRGHPEWTPYPVVVVDRDKPSGVVQWANESALARHIRPGMRYAAGLALSRQLRGGVVSHADIDAGVELVTDRLWAYSPRIEPSPRELEALARSLRGTRSAVAHGMGISPHTVKEHLQNLYIKLDVGTADEAAIALGWLVIPPGLAA